MPKEKEYKYPNPKKIQITDSDLKLKLKEYKEAIKKEASLTDLLVIFPAWLPVFTSDFRNVLGVPGSMIRGVYAAFVFIGTIVWIFSAQNTFMKFFKKIEKWLGQKNLDKHWFASAETDPCKKVEYLKEECR